MIPRVIEDSDEDSDALSPVRSASAEVKGPIAMTEVDGSESTDPVLFQEVYEKHRATINASVNEFPTLEDPIINQRMSSSPLPSGGRPKRSKSLHISSLTSLTEPTASNRVKRTKTFNIEDLTQITSPGIANDIWDVPSSGASDVAFGGVKSNNAGKTGLAKTLKTYGKNKRSKSVVPRSSSPEVREDQDIFSPETLKRSIPDDPDSLKRTKRQKQVHATQNSDIYGVSSERNPVDEACNTSGESSVKVQVPRSTSDQSRQNVGSQKKIGSSIVTSTQSLPAIAETPVGNKNTPENSYVTQTTEKATSSIETPIGNKNIPGNFYVTQTTEKATSSISVVPDMLTSSQRLQYPECPVIDSTASDLSRRSSIAEDQLQTELDGQHELDAKTTSKKPKDIPQIVSPDLSIEIDNALKEASQTLTLPIPSLGRKHIPRSRTEVSRSHRDNSFDELSLETNDGSSRAAKRKSAGGKKGIKHDERVNADKYFGADEIGLPHELYRPRPSSRRTQSVGLTESEVSADLDRLLSSMPRAKRRSGKMGQKTQEVEESIIVATTGSQEHLTPEDDREVTSVENSKSQTSLNKEREDITEFDAKNGKGIKDAADVENDVNPPVITVISAPKRGRPKKVLHERKAEIMETPVAVQENSVKSTEGNVTSSVAPRPRGRPKKQKSITTEVMETQEAKSTKNTNQHAHQPSPDLGRKSTASLDELGSADIINATNKNEAEKNRLEQTVLSERNDNSYYTPAATPTKPTEPLRTPTKEVTTKGPDQHSPLRRDRVAYRVGLSKKRKIAPLLKIIRK